MLPPVESRAQKLIPVPREHVVFSRRNFLEASLLASLVLPLFLSRANPPSAETPLPPELDALNIGPNLKTALSEKWLKDSPPGWTTFRFTDETGTVTQPTNLVYHYFSSDFFQSVLQNNLPSEIEAIDNFISAAQQDGSRFVVRVGDHNTLAALHQLAIENQHSSQLATVVSVDPSSGFVGGQSVLHRPSDFLLDKMPAFIEEAYRAGIVLNGRITFEKLPYLPNIEAVYATCPGAKSQMEIFYHGLTRINDTGKLVITFDPATEYAPYNDANLAEMINHLDQAQRKYKLIEATKAQMDTPAMLQLIGATDSSLLPTEKLPDYQTAIIKTLVVYGRDFDKDRLPLDDLISVILKSAAALAFILGLRKTAEEILERQKIGTLPPK